MLAAPSPGSRNASAKSHPSSQRTCEAWDVAYALDAKLRLSHTPLHAGDGTYSIGPGELVLRFYDPGGKAEGNVQMLGYRLKERFSIKRTMVFSPIEVTVKCESGVDLDPCGSAAEGVLSADTLRWTGGVRGYHTVGTTSCKGRWCGRLGAPAAGTAPLQIGPAVIAFGPFQFNKNRTRFTMDYAFVSKTKLPKQTAHLMLAGRQVRRRCSHAPACP